MVKIAAVLVPILLSVCMYLLSAWRTLRIMAKRSHRLADESLVHVSQRLARAAGVSGFNVYVYEIDQVNGLVTPNGRIYITQGLLGGYLNGEFSPDEVASVIAHEMGHVALGHTKRRMLDFAGQNALRYALSVLLSRFLPGIGQLVAGLLMAALANRLSQADEYAADAYATALLIKAGIGTGPQKRLLRKLEPTAGSTRSAAPWMLSHPKTEKRIEAIERIETRST